MLDFGVGKERFLSMIVREGFIEEVIFRVILVRLEGVSRIERLGMRLEGLGKNILGRRNRIGRKEFGIFEELKGGYCGYN